jgi:hypothetical protein
MVGVNESPSFCERVIDKSHVSSLTANDGVDAGETMDKTGLCVHS